MAKEIDYLISSLCKGFSLFQNHEFGKVIFVLNQQVKPTQIATISSKHQYWGEGSKRAETFTRS